MIEQQPRQLRKERAYLGSLFQRISAHDHRNRKLRAHILNCNNKIEKVKSKWRWSFTLKTCPQWFTYSNKATPPKPPQIVPPTGDQASEYHRLWVAFLMQIINNSQKRLFLCVWCMFLLFIYLFILEVSLTMLLRLASDFTILPLLSFQVLGLRLSLTLCINADIHPQINVQHPQ